LDVFIIDSISIFTIFSVIMWSYFVYMGFVVAKAKLSRDYILPLLIMFFLFPIFSAITYLMAYISEFTGKEYKW